MVYYYTETPKQVIFSVLAMKKHAAAREVFGKVPADSVKVIIRETEIETGSEELAADDDNAVREYLCHQAYLVGTRVPLICDFVLFSWPTVFDVP